MAYFTDAQIAEILAKIRANGVEIADLTEVQTLPDGSYFELSGGRKIAAETILSLLRAAAADVADEIVSGERDMRISADEALHDADIAGSGTSATNVVLRRNGGADPVTIPSATPARAGVMTAAQALLLSKIAKSLQYVELGMFASLLACDEAFITSLNSAEALGNNYRIYVANNGATYQDVFYFAVQNTIAEGHGGQEVVRFDGGRITRCLFYEGDTTFREEKDYALAEDMAYRKKVYGFFAYEAFTEVGLMRSNGTISTSASYLHTQPVPVEEVEKLYLYNKIVAETATSFFPIVVWLDANGGVVGYEDCVAGESDYELIPPKGAQTAVFNTLKTFAQQTEKIVCHADIVSSEPYRSRIYISTVGSDDNDGLTQDTPVKTLRKANMRLAPDGELVMLAGDYYDLPLDLSNYGRLTGSGRVRLISGYRVSAATAMSGYTRVLSATIDKPPVSGTYLWQHDVADAATAIAPDEVHPVQEGATHRLPSTRIYPAASIAEIEASADVLKWYVSGTTLYFSIAAGTDLATHPVVIPRRTVAASEGGSIEVRNVRFLYSGLLLGGMHGMLENVSVGMTNAAGAVRYDGTTDFLMRRCEAFGCSNDGFNGHGTADNPSDIVLEDCWGHDNCDDGESCHEHCTVTSRGGLYEYNGNGCTPASGGRAAYYGTMARKNLPTHAWTGSSREGTGFSAQGAAPSGAETAMLCHACYATANSIGIRSTLTTGTIAIDCVAIGNGADYTGNVEKRGLLQHLISKYAAYGADYDTNSGTWRMHKVGNQYLITGLSAADMERICASPDFNTSDIFTGAMQNGAKTNRPINTYRVVRASTYPADFTQMARGNTSIEVFYALVSGAYMFRVKDMVAAFYGCTALRVVKYLDVSGIQGFGNAFYGCTALEECFLRGVDKDLDLGAASNLTQASLIYIVENAGTSAKTLTVTGSITGSNWSATETYPTWLAFETLCQSKNITIQTT